MQCAFSTVLIIMVEHLITVITLFYLRYLVPSNDFSIENIHTFLTSVSQEAALSSWKNIASHIDGANEEQDDFKVAPPLFSSVSKGTGIHDNTVNTIHVHVHVPFLISIHRSLYINNRPLCISWYWSCMVLR